MRILPYETLAPSNFPRRPVLTLGVFDGVHRGHQAVLQAVVDRARERRASSLVLTFDRHPGQVLDPAHRDRSLLSLARRLELIAASGVEFVCVLPFTGMLAALSAEDFAQSVIAARVNPAGVVLGYNTRFGQGGQGDAALLSRALAARRCPVQSLDPVLSDHQPISSTRIRALIEAGALDQASDLLGRPVEVCGTVVSGAGRGRTLGFPTANLALEHALLPPRGVYGARARPTEGEPRWALLNLGVNPTFETESSRTRVEAHLLDFDGDLRGTRLRLELRLKLRDERRFPSAPALVAQITADRERFRALIASFEAVTGQSG